MNLKEQLVNSFSLCSSNNCLEKLDLQAFEMVDDQSELRLPCRRVSNNGEFKVENPHGRLLHLLKIDFCILFEVDGKKCDFVVFSDEEMIFVELKKIKEGTRTTFLDRKSGKKVEKADYKFGVAVGQLKNTLDIFRCKNIDLRSTESKIICDCWYLGSQPARD